MSPSFSPAPLDTGEGARDFQDRVGRFARAVFVLAAVMAGASTVTHVATHGAAGNLMHQVIHLFTLAPSLAVWFRCRGKAMGTGMLELVDATLTITTCVLYAVLGLSAASSLAVTFSVLLGMTYTLVWRSIIVPSSFHRTLWISAPAAACVAVYFVLRSEPSTADPSPESNHILVMFAALWCVFAVFAAATSSRQLYGLRVQIGKLGKLGQYTLDEKIGEGGMGVVHRATHSMLRRPAAIKILSKDRASERDQARFESEVQLTSQLAHPNTVSIFDYGRTADGTFYYVMEYLNGLDLERLVAESGPLAPARVIHILAQVCGALGEAHALGLIHRDIKPANIMLTERVDEPDVVKVVDFGLVKTLERSDGDSRTGTITGTPMYLSPEAITAPETVDGRTDIYALGAVAYFLLAGRNVFEGQTVVELLSRHLFEQAAPPSSWLDRPLPSDLESLVLACLAKDRTARPASASLLLTALLACDDASRYDRDLAIAWWRDRRARGPGGTRDAVAGSPATMAVDLRHRNSSASVASRAVIAVGVARR